VHERHRPLAATTVLLAVILLSGCGLISSIPGLGGPSGPRIDPPAPGIDLPAPVPVPTPIVGGPGGGTGGGSGGASGAPGAGGAPGTGGDTPIGTDLPPGGLVPGPGIPTIVVPHPGQVGLREVSPVELRSRIDAAGHVIVRVRWWGGIEPCDVLDSVTVTRDGDTLTIAARVGSAAGGQVACIDIARDTATLVDLGVLAAGRYTVRASAGDAPPITVTVP
jgi:hypothetical protein